ncbi:MAG TPA: hypothetical protein VJU81_02100 [Methylomirabilota bacterium]|nr:hypothetical protein [Methylomirabilota bacterium]
MRRVRDLSQYRDILPYASEIFGVYQPMLGWRSRRIQGRIEKGFRGDLARVFGSLYGRFKGRFEFSLDDRRSLEAIRRLEPAELRAADQLLGGSFVLESVARSLPPLEDYKDTVWNDAIRPERIQDTLRTTVVPEVTRWHHTAVARGSQEPRGTGARTDDGLNEQVAAQLNRESAVAGFLLYLKANNQLDALKRIFYKPDEHLGRLLQVLRYQDPLEWLDPFRDIERVSMSPIGIVHLFRQYFFEFDTFLGPPVGHVWLSPGASVELVEISTRRTRVERTTETQVETLLKTEETTTERDEIADAVKEDNRSATMFGVSTTANQAWIGGSASATAGFSMAGTQAKARETTHRRMRQQTEKLSTEIRKNVKTTFKVVTEATDTSSKRYILANTTQQLINYEMRRKMRQVGVQVQDIGTYLCWQTYVDDPGRQLGVAKLVHLAKEPDVGSVPPPEAVPMPGTIVTEHDIEIPFVPRTQDTDPNEDMDEIYEDGKEYVTEDVNEDKEEKIESNFSGFVAACDQAGYQYGSSIQFDYGGNDIRLSILTLVEEQPGRIRFGVHVDHVNFRNVSPLRVKAKVTWRPTADTVTAINAQNKANVDRFNEQTRLAFQRAFVDAARDRINKAGSVTPRPFDELREEERIVVYRALVQEMLTKDLPMPDDRTRHAVAELLNAIFDVDKMLYFTGPEWWRPRLHRSHQALGGIREPSPMPVPEPLPVPATEPATDGVKKVMRSQSTSIYTQVKSEALSKVVSGLPGDALGKVATGLPGLLGDTQIASMDRVSWGGESRTDSYYITEESAPAPLGASLGWLLQLDGDNLRNAFLNAPWVKAVLPIRPGKERAAINWLQRLHVEGTDGLGDAYVAPADELAQIPHAGSVVTIRDAINHLCDVVAEKHEAALQVGRYPSDEINDDNRVSSTPIEKVYEHGFYPLQGGFRAMPGTEAFEVFDQWVEVLPTDQIVPVEVAYDPTTGRQV